MLLSLVLIAGATAMRGRAVVMVIVPPPHAAEAEGGDLGDEEEHVRSVRGPIRWVMAVEGVQRCAHAWLTRGEWGRANTGVARPSLVRAVAAVRVGCVHASGASWEPF